LTSSAGRVNNTPSKKYEGVFDMKGITAIDRCKVCGKGFTQDNKYQCPDHLTSAQRFRITFFYKGEMYRRSTTLNGATIASIQDANALYRRAMDDISGNKFLPERWQSKKKFELQFGYLIDKWYSEKEGLMLRGRLSPSYLPKLRQYVKIYYKPFFGNEDVTEIHSLKDFANSLPATHSPKYQKNILDALRSFFIWLREDRIIEYLPKAYKVEVPEYNFKVISTDTQYELLSHIPEEHQPIFTFLFFQGCRPSEVRALKWKDIEDDIITICRTWSNHILREQTKTKNVRKIYLFPQVKDALPRREFPESFVFTHGKTLKRPYGKTHLNDIFKAACGKMGLEIKLYEATKHSWSTAQYQDGVSIKLLQKYHGHKSDKMTERYTRIDVVDVFRQREKNKVIQMDKAKDKSD
jgi:integrase